MGADATVVIGRIRLGIRVASITCTTPDTNSNGRWSRSSLVRGLLDSHREPICRLARPRHVGAYERTRGVHMSSGIPAGQLLGTPDLPGRGRRGCCPAILSSTLREGGFNASTPSTSLRLAFSVRGQCGTAGSDYQSVGASPGINVLSVHDYYGSAAMGGDRWNGMAVRFAQAKALDKPIIAGEGGILAGNGQAGCESLQQRALDLSAKIATQFAAGESAYLVWNWVLDPIGPCSANTGPSDSSLLAALASAPVH